VTYGTWYARSAEFMQTPTMNTLRWLRMFGDTIFAVGALVLGWFVLGLVTGSSYSKTGYVDAGEWQIKEKPENVMAD
jgi:nitric oxide reductase subunit B